MSQTNECFEFIPLINVAWVSTSRCNLTCSHCYAAAEKKGERMLTLHQVKKYVLDEMEHLRSEYFSITGGEPLIRSDLFQIIENSRERGLKVTLATNGTLIDQDTAVKIAASGLLSVQISLDGARPMTNDTIRGQGSFALIVKGIRTICKHRVKVAVSFTPMKMNLGELRDVVMLAEDCGAAEVSIRRFVPLGRGGHLEPQRLTQQERLKLFRKIRELQEDFEGRIKIGTNDPMFFVLQEDADVLADDQTLLGGCSAGIFGVAVQANGDVTPCTGLYRILGNVRRTPLRAIWNNSPILNLFRNRDNLQGRCGKCKYRYICGGCREAAYQHTGSLLGEDRDCLFMG